MTISIFTLKGEPNGKILLVCFFFCRVYIILLKSCQNYDFHYCQIANSSEWIFAMTASDWQNNSEVVKCFSCSVNLSMECIMLILLESSFMHNRTEYEIYPARKC